ncbi:MAG: DUF3108 domain-containing protein [Thioalkalivibrio sp.]|nr:MAG: DUF3108 domain-containing protein [Thioalkalivibrio sp.]
MRWHYPILILCLAGTAQAGSPTAIPPYTATYEAHAYGNRLIAQSTLNHEGENLHMALDAHVSGFLRLLGRFEFDREAVFRPGDDHLRLLSTRSSRITPRRERSAETRFDWSTGRAHGRYNGTAFDVEVPSDTVDFLSSVYLTMTRLRDNDLDSSFGVTVLERDRLRDYTLALEGRERIDTELGRKDTLRVVRKSANSDVELSGWFAPDLHYLPLRLDYEADGHVFRLELTKLEWHEPMVIPPEDILP